MASALPPGVAAASSSDSDFAFAFNDSKFSNRILRIEIIPDFPETQSDGQECTSLADGTRERKRRRVDIKRDNVVDSIAHREERILSSQMPETEKGVGANQDEEAVAKVKGSPSDAGVKPDQLGDQAARSDNSTVIEVKTLHINSAILAAKSPFFYKLFSNGMIESVQRHVTLPIHASEAAALMDLLNFMYSNTLTARTHPALLDVLRAADKFAVTSCMRYCSGLLRDLPMTRESALEYLDLHSSLLMADAVQPLTAAAKQFLVGLYQDIAKFHDDIPNLPLAGLEAVLSNDDLQVASEDVVYDIVLKWARTHYPKLEERREIFGSRLSCLIRFPYMTGQKLMNCLACDDFDREHVTKLVLEALLFKTQASRRPRTLDAETQNSSHHRYVERAYKFRPTKVVEFELPRKECILYLDLKRDEGARLFPAGRVFSQPFHLGSQLFILSAHCKMDQRSSLPYFGLLLFMLEMGSVSLSVEYSMRSKSTKDYMIIFKGTCTFTGGRPALHQNSFSVPWTTFMAEESPYFVNDILHLRAVLIIEQ